MRRALVADDEDVLRGLIRAALESLGYEVEEARDGLEAVKFVREKCFDLIVLDVNMPRLDGLEALRQIHELRPAVTVIVASATSAASAAHEVGATAFVTKRPDTFLGELVAVVKNLGAS